MSKSKKIIIAAIVLIIIVLVMFILSQAKPQKTTPPVPVSPTITAIPSEVSKNKEVLDVYPPQDTNSIFLPIQQITITFSIPVLPEDIRVDSAPQILLKVKNDPNDIRKIIISPDPVWKEGITEIRITNSDSGRILSQEVRYKINTSFPKNPQQPVP